MNASVTWIREFWKYGAVLLVIACFDIPAAAQQKAIKGIVIDSASFSPLPGVNIQIKGTYRGSATDSKGEFRMLVKPTDTLIFSLVGYLPEEFAAAELEATTLIRLAEEIRILQTINVSPKPDEKYVKPLTLRAGKGALMNYGNSGPGVNLGYFSKAEREKRKLHAVLERQAQQHNYVAVVTSPEVRERIIYDFKLTEDQYYQILAGFNIENGNSLYELTSEELIVVMNEYYRNHLPRKR